MKSLRTATVRLKTLDLRKLPSIQNHVLRGLFYMFYGFWNLKLGAKTLAHVFLKLKQNQTHQHQRSSSKLKNMHNLLTQDGQTSGAPANIPKPKPVTIANLGIAPAELYTTSTCRGDTECSPIPTQLLLLAKSKHQNQPWSKGLCQETLKEFGGDHPKNLRMPPCAYVKQTTPAMMAWWKLTGFAWESSGGKSEEWENNSWINKSKQETTIPDTLTTINFKTSTRASRNIQRRTHHIDLDIREKDSCVLLKFGDEIVSRFQCLSYFQILCEQLDTPKHQMTLYQHRPQIAQANLCAINVEKGASNVNSAKVGS